VYEPVKGSVREDILPSCPWAKQPPAPFTSVHGERPNRSSSDGWLTGFRMAWNLLALSSGPFAFGFGIYWLISHAWWEGVAAIAVAPFFGLALIAAATFVETLREESTAMTPLLGGLPWGQSTGDIGGNANPLG
jgi:hypothetical protein